MTRSRSSSSSSRLLKLTTKVLFIHQFVIPSLFTSPSYASTTFKTNHNDGNLGGGGSSHCVFTLTHAFQPNQRYNIVPANIIPNKNLIKRHDVKHKSDMLNNNPLLFKYSIRGGGGYGNNNHNNHNHQMERMDRTSSTKLYSMISPIVTSPPAFDNTPFLQSNFIFAITNIVGFLISVCTGSHLHLDLLGTGAFAISSLPTLLSSSSTIGGGSCAHVTLSSAAVFIWGTKLACFLFFRATKLKHDARLNDTLSTISGTFGFWFISFLWGIICSLPHTLGTTSSNPGSPLTLTIGCIVYILGICTESMADYQKWQFKNSVLPNGNGSKFCNVGLWSISQHPNFFGNLLLWLGIFIMNMDSLLVVPTALAAAGGEGSSDNGSSGILGMVNQFLSTIWQSRRFGYALLSPLFMWTLFYGQASGNITNAVELSNQKYGNDPLYQRYVSDVPLIIPKNIWIWLKTLLLPVLPFGKEYIMKK